MRNLLKDKKRQESLFIISFMIYIISTLETITMFNQISYIAIICKVLRYLTYLLFAFLAFFSFLPHEEYVNLKNKSEKISLVKVIKDFFKEFFLHPFLLFMIVLSFIILIVSKNRIPIILVLIICASNKIEFNKILKCFVVGNICFSLFTILSESIGIIPDVVISRSNGALRYSMGFVYPLELMSNYLFIILGYSFIRKNKFNYTDLFVINVINILLFKITDARMSFILIVMFTSMLLILNKINTNKIFSILKKDYFFIFVLFCSIGSIFISVFYNEGNFIMNFLNNILSGRLALGKNGLLNYGVPLFGKSIEWVGFGAVTDLDYALAYYNFVDCSYIKNMLDYGVVFLIIVIIGYMYVLKLFYDKKDIVGILVICFILMISILEPRLLQIEMNPFLLLMSSGLLIKIRGERL